jgi:CheY-like chemotaxis protein
VGATADTDQEELGLLVIEDDETFAGIVGDLARQARFRPLLATRGDVGLAMARELRPAAILLDLRLPGVDGWSLLDRLKHDAGTAHIPVVVMSGDARSARAVGYGAFRFLHKPIDADTFMSVFEELRALATAQRRTLLLVEPEPHLRGELLALLGGDDIAITAASSATGAIALLGGMAFDGALIASRLPDGSAADVVRALGHDGTASGPMKRDMPIVVLARPEEEVGEIREALRAVGATLSTHVVASVEHALERTVRLLHRSEMHLPENARAALRRAQRAESVLKGRRVLLVEDDGPSAFALSSVLRAYGLEVMVARDGPACLDMLGRGTPVDAILMDILLPEMDGYEVIRRIRKIDTLRAVPVIALTALAMRGDRERCMSAGASSYLPKPVDTDQLLALLRVAFSTADLAADL